MADLTMNQPKLAQLSCHPVHQPTGQGNVRISRKCAFKIILLLQTHSDCIAYANLQLCNICVIYLNGGLTFIQWKSVIRQY